MFMFHVNILNLVYDIDKALNSPLIICLNLTAHFNSKHRSLTFLNYLISISSSTKSSMIEH